MSDRGTVKPTATEDEYFVREDAEKKRKLAQAAMKELEAAERARLKQLHWMRCPKCGLELHEVKYQQIDADVCFACGGVFLDKGELEQIARPEKHGVVSAILNWIKPEGGK